MPGRPAARITDNVAHPAPPVLTPGPGSMNVLIGMLPAWRGIPLGSVGALQAAKQISDTAIHIAEAATLAAAGTPGLPAAKAAEETTKATAAASMGSMITSMAMGADIHGCTTPLPLPPHGPGVVIDGSPTVLINGLPACRMGDTIIEAVGPPNKIVKGDFTVLIGDTGSRPVITQSTGGLLGGIVGGILGGLGGALAGMMLGGVPGAIVGGLAGAALGAALGSMVTSTEVTKFGKSITIEGPPDYRAKVVRDLKRIESTPSGQKLLDSIEASGKTLRIHTDEGKGNWAWTDPPPKAGDANPPGYLKSGTAANTEIGYNPDRDRLTGPPGSPYNTAKWAQPPNRPPDVGLYHEMVHADDMMHGKLDSTNGVNLGPKAGSPIPNSELRAAGLPPFDKQPYSENTYRKDRGVVARDFY